jgi:hypothetical protein
LPYDGITSNVKGVTSGQSSLNAFGVEIVPLGCSMSCRRRQLAVAGHPTRAVKPGKSLLAGAQLWGVSCESASHNPMQSGCVPLQQYDSPVPAWPLASLLLPMLANPISAAAVRLHGKKLHTVTKGSQELLKGER